MKIPALQKYLQSEKLDAAIFLNTSDYKKDMNITYFTSLEDCEYGILVIPAKKPAFILVPEFELSRLQKSSKVKTLPIKGKPSDTIRKHLKNPKAIAINANTLSINELKALKKSFKAKFKDISSQLTQLRATKTKVEIYNATKACELTSNIVSKLVKNLPNLKTEQDASNFILNEIKQLNLKPSFEPIVASGTNGANPHHVPNDKKLNKGFCVIDLGLIYNGFCSDMTRTIFLGNPTKKESQVYNNLLKLQTDSINNLQLNQKASIQYNKVKKALGEAFSHSLGHGVGVEIHEFPNLSNAKPSPKLQENMIITIEPGVYYKNKFGIRIEDTLILTKKGPKVLTNYNKKLVTIF